MFSCLPLWSRLRVWSDYQGLTSLMCYEHHFSFPIPMVFLTVLSTLKYIQSLILNHQMPWWEKPHWILGSLTGLPLSGIWASQSLLPAFLVILSRSVVITMFTIIAGSITVYQLHFSSFVCPWHILHVYWLAPFIVMQRGFICYYVYSPTPCYIHRFENTGSPIWNRQYIFLRVEIYHVSKNSL